MRIAISIGGQSSKMSGIQHYVDSLLDALYAKPTKHEITAFAPSVWTSPISVEDTEDGLFAWRNRPQSRIQTLGNGWRLVNNSLFANSARRQRFAHRVDSRFVLPWMARSTRWRTRLATRHYDLLHAASSFYDHSDYCRAKHHTATIYDLTTRLHPWAHTDINIAGWEKIFDFAKHRCSRVIAISEATKRDIIEHIGIPAERIDVTPLAPRFSTRRIDDAEALRTSLEPFGLVDTPFVLYAGTLEPRKNVERLVRAFAQAAAQERHMQHKLVLAGGSWNDLDQDMLRLAYELGVGERVITTGYVSNAQMNALMSACSAFAYISLYEGFGLPPLEAMVCGAPVITSNVSSLPEVVGEAGIQVNPLDTDAVAAALHLLLTDSAENTRRRALSIERARLFSWERTAALTLRSYEAAVA